jgi:hypothetical protein
LKSLTFIQITPSAALPPQQRRRNKLLANLREQLAIARADAAGTLHIIHKRRWEMTETGDKYQIDVEKRLKRWWHATDTGIAVQVRWANKAIEFEKGKSAIQINKADELVALFEKLILAAANGEFDKFLTDINKQRKAFKPRAA